MSFSITKQTISPKQEKMDRETANSHITLFFCLLLFFSSHSTVHSKRINPFTAEASLVRYWKNHISNTLPPSPFLLSKASPLSPPDSAFFSKLASQNSLPSHLPSFCSAANLFCLLDSKPILENLNKKTDIDQDANFASYTNKRFSNYGASALGGADVFKNYSDSGSTNFATSSFSRYSRSSTARHEGFSGYSTDANVAAANFTSYAGAAAGGSGAFSAYAARVNVPDLHFTSYDSESNGHDLAFATYADGANSGNQAFAGYGKNANSAQVGFSTYGEGSNVIGSGFSEYGSSGNAANDSFKGYSGNSNNPSNNFKGYGVAGSSGSDTFTSYRESANAGADKFQSYGRSSSSDKTSFVGYGNSFNVGFDTFKEYGKGAVGFKSYDPTSKATFKEYARKNDVTFARYSKADEKKSRVEEGKFFRESMLREGNVMRMPDIRDRMPKRSFLPPTILSKLPLAELKRAFGPAMEGVIEKAAEECEREPSPGETKRCVGSAEGMIDFAVSVLGGDVAVRTTEGVRGSGDDVAIGRVRRIEGDRAVSCHQSLYPYLLYYCHAVPKVRVYEAEILDVETKTEINRGVAICHLDTSAWSGAHGAFLALGSGPGLIEVCHWIFENDMTWTASS